ncbi:hypothetical protein LCGC14_0903780 [marine sediment metagenome]|uniref:Uncharacterized protein n=1 Tax=marine sediment metagenome TaxID=412755 RepID=A0A0F9S2I6_9ZZZZ
MFNILEIREYDGASFSKKFAPVKLLKTSRRRIIRSYFLRHGIILSHNETLRIFEHNGIKYALKHLRDKNPNWGTATLTVMRLPDDFKFQ